MTSQFTLTEVIQIADDLVYNQTRKHLTDLERKVLSGSWQRKKYKDIAKECFVSVNYINRYVANQLWQNLTEASGEKVTKFNFQGVLEREWRIKKGETADTNPLASALSVTEIPSPESAAALDSPFYVELTPIESLCYSEILKPGALIRIKAPEKMGKTLLISQILAQLKTKGYRTARLSLKELDKEEIAHLELLLRRLCQEVSRELNLPDEVQEYWSEDRGNKAKCTSYFEEYLLPAKKNPLVLCIDDVDWLFPHATVCEDFCLMLRNWHEKAKIRRVWKQLRLIVAHSTEEYINLQDNHSPFNVGTLIELPELTLEQVQTFAQHCQLDWNKTQVEELMNLVGGHPYLIELALSHLQTHSYVNLDQLLTAAPTEQGIYSSYLREHLDTLQQNPDLMTAFKEVVTATNPFPVETLSGHKLRSMGLITWQGNQATPSCQLYRLYFGQRL